MTDDLPVDEDAVLLLVDDRPQNLTALEAVLEPLGFGLVSARSGEEALRHLLTTDVAVILLDVKMPGMSGFETAARIKERQRTKDIPIIFLTAHDADGAQAIEAFTSGAVDYVTKPCDPALLRAKVQVLVDHSLKTRLLQRQSEVLTRRLDERYASEARHLRKLAEAALAINSTLALRDMLRVVNDSAREIIEAQEAETIVRAGPDRNESAGALSYSPKYEAWSKVGADADVSPLYDLVWRSGRPVRMTKKEIEASFATRGVFDVAPGHPMLEGWLAAPLVGRTGRTLGLIQVADKEEGDFTEADEVVLVQLAQLASVAIENAERYEQEHLIAETLQRSLLPNELTDAPGVETCARYQPGGAGSQVGGDWYDVVPMEDGRVALSVGDVMGRGPRAAAVMGQLRTAMRAYSVLGLPPTSLMVSLDRLLQDLHQSSIATVAHIVLDPASGRAEVVLAGHPPPLLVRPGERPEYLRCNPHAPLGALPNPVYTPTVVRVPPGSTLLLYTDGLVEERDAALDDGLARLQEAVDLFRGDLAELCDGVLSKMIDGEKGDDIALLAARVTYPA